MMPHTPGVHKLNQSEKVFGLEANKTYYEGLDCKVKSITLNLA